MMVCVAALAGQHPAFSEPAGSTLRTIAYCKKDAVAKKKM
jgi:hypothetical protein